MWSKNERKSEPPKSAYSTEMLFCKRELLYGLTFIFKELYIIKMRYFKTFL